MRVTATDISKVFATDQGPLRAIDHLSFEIDRGTATAVIGPNGAGKSTLLRMISGITVPTNGIIRRSARCASLIELGAGFHADLTGRENLEMGMAMAGLRGRDLSADRDAAIEFSGLGDRIDLPLKHFSSGMVGRISCAVALHSRPDLLLIDEVLAVGDAEFQRNLLARVGDLIAEGSALVLVTHSPELASMATTRTLWIDAGRLVEDGPTSDILTRYEASARGWGRAFGTPSVVLGQIAVKPTVIHPRGSVRVAIELEARSDRASVSLRVEMRPTIGEEPWMRSDEDSLEVWLLNLIATTERIDLPPLTSGRHLVDVDVASVPVSPSHVELSVLLLDASGLIIDEAVLGLQIGGAAGRPTYDLDPQISG